MSSLVISWVGCGSLVGCSLLVGCGDDPPRERSGAREETPPRQSAERGEQTSGPVIYAVGDVHGDLQAARRALALTGCVDDAGHWTGGRNVVVQVGDQLDRGDDEPEILAWFDRLRDEARAAGGRFVALNGNHEIMNAALDFRYVTPDGIQDFADTPGASDVEALPESLRGRASAFRPGGPMAELLAEQPVAVKVGRTLFVHGGLLPEHVHYGLERLNDEVARWLRGEGPLPAIMQGPRSPVWHRGYSADTRESDCQDLERALQAADADRMVVAHTVQPDGITHACGGRVYRVDVGLARHYGGRAQALRIRGREVEILR